MLDRIKVVLGLQDCLQDEVLDILISNANKHLRAELGKDIPPHLDFIVEEVTIRRYNRLGTEGMQSESVEGHSISFYDLADEFVPYQGIIDNEVEKDKPIKRGQVMFL